MFSTIFLCKGAAKCRHSSHVSRWENSSVASLSTGNLLSLTGSYMGLQPCLNISQESLLTEVKMRREADTLWVRGVLMLKAWYLFGQRRFRHTLNLMAAGWIFRYATIEWYFGATLISWSRLEGHYGSFHNVTDKTQKLDDLSQSNQAHDCVAYMFILYPAVFLLQTNERCSHKAEPSLSAFRECVMFGCNGFQR